MPLRTIYLNSFYQIYCIHPVQVMLKHLPSPYHFPVQAHEQLQPFPPAAPNGTPKAGTICQHDAGAQKKLRGCQEQRHHLASRGAKNEFIVRHNGWIWWHSSHPCQMPYNRNHDIINPKNAPIFFLKEIPSKYPRNFGRGQPPRMPGWHF